MDKNILDNALERAKAAGIRNILALRGDPPRGEEYWQANADSQFNYAVDLVKYIRKNYGSVAVSEGDDSEFIIEPPAPGSSRGHRRSSVNAHNRLIVSDLATAGKSAFLTVSESDVGPASDIKSQLSDDILAISTGEGALGREANWDDFPNGRFGDSRSPAYGEIDGYGPSLHVDNKKAYKIWGYPVDSQDISTIFKRHITGQLDAIPWSDQALDAETMLIQEQLLNLNDHGLFTIASQPACNAEKSKDKIFGWGPENGRVFQKPFVEFFISPKQFEKLQVIIATKNKEEGDIYSYYATTSDKKLMTNLPSGSSNAVTWGVFPNREILQSTIIEEESFVAWSEEAFSIWKEWQRLYKKNSASYKLLDDIYKTYYLVTALSHDYMNDSALWETLLEV